MFYELWDVDSGNMIGDFDSEAEALQVVRDLLEDNEPDYADALSLGRHADDGSFALVAEGADLAERARMQRGPSRQTV